jgi:predicted O-methyltransferase YrrM
MWSRVVTGDGLRKTRLHTFSGNRIDLRGLMYLPKSVWSVILLKVLGYRQRVPWLGYRAVQHLGGIIQPHWRVLEFGSGMSSLFLAQRCHLLVSIESDPAWYGQMHQLFARRGIVNVDYRLRDPDGYTALPDLADHSFDLVVVDGLVRDQAALVALQKVKPGEGYVFLDNSDVPWPEHKAARRVLTAAAEADGVRVFNDLYPFQLQVNESMLVKVRGGQDATQGTTGSG